MRDKAERMRREIISKGKQMENEKEAECEREGANKTILRAQRYTTIPESNKKQESDDQGAGNPQIQTGRQYT